MADYWSTDYDTPPRTTRSLWIDEGSRSERYHPPTRPLYESVVHRASPSSPAKNFESYRLTPESAFRGRDLSSRVESVVERSRTPMRVAVAQQQPWASMSYERAQPHVFSQTARKMPSMVKDPCATFLPPTQGSRDRLCIVLDLDETLVFGRDGPIVERPGARELLQALARENCEVVVWTAAERAYAHDVIRKIDPSGVISHCVYRHHKWWTGRPGYSKNLRALGRNIHRTVLIDNTPDCFREYPEHGILVSDFEGRGDNILLSILEILIDCIRCEDFSVPEILHGHLQCCRQNVPCDNGGVLQLFTLRNDRVLSGSEYYRHHVNRDSPDRYSRETSYNLNRGLRARTPTTVRRW